MRSTLALAGLGLGLALTVLPATSASAYCGPDTGAGDPGCQNGCVETGERYEALRASIEAKTGAVLPSYWDIVLCPM